MNKHREQGRLEDWIAMEATIKTVTEVLNGIVASADAELQQMSQADLEGHWHFRWDDSASLERNLYEFHDMLELYGGFCRRWEEKHNGTCCVVERVRDTYLMPKIREFAAKVSTPPNAAFSGPGAEAPQNSESLSPGSAVTDS